MGGLRSCAGGKESRKACLLGWKENRKNKSSVDRNLSGVERPCMEVIKAELIWDSGSIHIRVPVTLSS